MEPTAEIKPSTTVARHRMVLLALGACTAVMVALSLLPLPTGIKIALVLTVALAEASLVAGVLMHLFSERKLIFSVLLLTGIFFALLLLLPLLSEADHTSHFFK
jgi:membrane protease YdiL (CAAX protease family)